MNVGELIDYLSSRPREELVILAKDAEGNGYSPLSEADKGFYVAESTWSGDVEEDDGGGGDPVVVLWPVN